MQEIKQMLSSGSNVLLSVIDSRSGNVLRTHAGHNAATNTFIYSCAQRFISDNTEWAPRYISLGTMGLLNQQQTDNHTPSGIGTYLDTSDTDVVARYKHYIDQRPGYGADGYNSSMNNDRQYIGLGPSYTGSAINCELVADVSSATLNFVHKRSPIISVRVVPEYESSSSESVDVYLTAMISDSALKTMMGDLDYIFITECGLWSTDKVVSASGDYAPSDSFTNGLLAAYRIMPPGITSSDMDNAESRTLLENEILRVEQGQIVQVVWKITFRPNS